MEKELIKNQSIRSSGTARYDSENGQLQKVATNNIGHEFRDKSIMDNEVKPRAIGTTHIFSEEMDAYNRQ